MKKYLKSNIAQICLVVASCCFQSIKAQELTWGISVGTELAGDYLRSDYVIGGFLQYPLGRNFFVQTQLRFSHGVGFIGGNDSGQSSNAIGLLDYYTYEGDVKYDELSPGVTGQARHITNEALFVITNGYQVGYRQRIGSRFNLIGAAGISLNYMQFQSLAEEGDAWLAGSGREDLMWYRAPSYMRGIGVNLSTTLGLEYSAGHYTFGVWLNPEIATDFKSAVGNRYPLMLVITTGLNRKTDSGLSEPRRTHLRAGVQWTYLGHSQLDGVRYLCGVSHELRHGLSIRLTGAMSYASGNRNISYFNNDNGYVLADRDDLEKWYDPEGGPSGLGREEDFISTFPLRTATTMQFDVIPSLALSLFNEHLSLSTGLALSWIDKKYLADERIGNFTNLLGEFDEVVLVSPYYTNYFDIGWASGIEYKWNVGDTWLGLEINATGMSSGDWNLSMGAFAEF